MATLDRVVRSYCHDAVLAACPRLPFCYWETVAAVAMTSYLAGSAQLLYDQTANERDLAKLNGVRPWHAEAMRKATCEIHLLHLTIPNRHLTAVTEYMNFCYLLGKDGLLGADTSVYTKSPAPALKR